MFGFLCRFHTAYSFYTLKYQILETILGLSADGESWYQIQCHFLEVFVNKTVKLKFFKFLLEKM